MFSFFIDLPCLKRLASLMSLLPKSSTYSLKVILHLGVPLLCFLLPLQKPGVKHWIGMFHYPFGAPVLLFSKTFAVSTPIFHDTRGITFFHCIACGESICSNFYCQFSFISHIVEKDILKQGSQVSGLHQQLPCTNRTQWKIHFGEIQFYLYNM